MPLNPGTRLGSYEIGAAIGAGGMGEVYRARDAKLNREVAIKVLPEHLALDPAALARFEREAQAVAALSHPNILSIHDFGVADIAFEGKPATRVAYAVTELLEGETLRAKLADGALSPRKAVEYALQIVHGIAAAHRKGVIHRDLKPENLFVTQDGRVKILDFGLAKAKEPVGEGSVTHVATGTSPGTIMGTVGYMSPEQVRGIAADHRTDIFSFGVVFYEMLAGLRPFRGDSHVETMNAILKEDPPEFTVAGGGVPAALDRIVRRCLEKAPDERFHSAHDLGLALETLSSSSSSSSGQSAASMAPLPAAKGRRAMPVLLGVGALAVAAAAFFAGHRLGAPQSVDSPAYRRLTFRHGSVYSARYASDGTTIVYSAEWSDEPRRLYSTREESPESLALPFDKADVTSISSSGELALILNRRTLAGNSRVGTLARASLSGGAARAVLEDVQDADWLPDGSGFAVAHFVDGRFRLEAPVGKTLYETNGYVSDVRVSPDGAFLAFLEHPILGDDRGSLAIIDRGGGKPRILASGYSSAQGVAWTRRGDEIWFTASDLGSARALFAVTKAGVLRTILRAPGNLHLGDVGADGSALLWEENSRTGIVGRAPGETKDRDLSWLDWSTAPRLSTDGRMVVFTEEGDGGGVDYSVYLRRMDGSPAVRLGSGVAMEISPDGKWVLATRLNPAPAQFVLLPTGAGEAKAATTGSLVHEIGWFTPDGTHIIFRGFEPDHPARLYRQDLSGGPPEAITPEGVIGMPSPDGTLAAFAGQLVPIGGGTARPIPGFEPDDVFSGWTADSRSVFVRRRMASGETHVFRLDASGKRTLVHRIEPVPGRNPGVWFDITPDGSAYVMTYTDLQSTLYRVTGLR